METIVEKTTDEEMIVSEPESTESSGTERLNTFLEGLIACSDVRRLKDLIVLVTNTFGTKEGIFQIRDFYHYFCVITESTINEQCLTSAVPVLKTFYQKVITVCHEWKDLSDHFESDFRFLNLSQCLLKSIIDKLNANEFDNEVTNHLIPLMLTSIIVLTATVHGLKEVVFISKPITTEIVLKRKTSGLSISTNEWKELIACMTNVCNVWAPINDINRLDGQNLCKFVAFLVDLSLGNDPFVTLISFKAIKCLSHEKNMSLDQLFIETQFNISAYILDILTIGSNFDSLGDLLQKTMSLFDINCLPRELLKHIIPYFAVKCSKRSKMFFEELSKVDGNRVPDVIKIYLTEIIRYMFYSKPFEINYQNLKKLIDFLSDLSDSDITYRLKVISYELVNTLLMHLSIDYDSTLKGIAFVHYFKVNEELNPDFNLNDFAGKESLLRETLKEYFLQYIHKFDSLMHDKSRANREKISANKSFVLLIQFMGNECINLFKVKIFSTIKLILSERFYSNKELIKYSIEAMAQFIKMIDESYLSSQLLTISALMLPLMHFWPIETSNVFKDVILNHKSNPSFQSSFKHLYFIPDMPQLIEVTEVLKPYIHCSDNEEEICSKITLVVNNINHENSRVQEFSLRELKNLLLRHQSLIYNKCNNVKEIDCDYFVNQIVTQLMRCLKSGNESALQLTAECLGILGAIDPSRLDLEKPIISKEEKSEMFLNANETEFKVTLITLLYKAITTATKTEDQYSASFALQEIIKIFTNIGFKIQELPQELCDFCAVLQKTRYHSTTNLLTTTAEPETEPLFGSTPDLTFNGWLNRWLTSLFQSYIFNREEKAYSRNDPNAFVSQSSLTSSQRSELFESELSKTLFNHSINPKVLNVCFLALLINQNIGQFLLPYIVITALKNATQEQRQYIVNEIKVIIKTLTTDESVFLDEIGPLSAQTVFHIYDYLKIWRKNRDLLHKKICLTPRQKKIAGLKDKEYKGVKYFLDNLSTQDLAVLAFKCNAMSRSLRYLEDYVKCNENTFQEEISFFQKIFILLNEPDSVDGCNLKRIRSPNIYERILTHEAMGQIQEALVCCAKAVELNPNDFECQQKYLQTSMDSFDQSELVYTYGTGLMIRHPEWRTRLEPYVVEAAWKLGDWTQLDQLIQQQDINSFSTFGSLTGDVFCSMIKRKDLNEFDEKLTNLRKGLVGPLSAAAMEISGYIRGHKYLVDLHILSDIQMICDHLMTELDEDVCSLDPLKTKFLNVMNVWDQRNDLVRKTIKCQEPILNTQRALLAIVANRAECADLLPLIKKELFKSWLKSTKTSRKSGNIQRSYNCLLEMNKMRELLTVRYGEAEGVMPSVSLLSDIENSDAIIETAKVQWNKNNKLGAIHYLKSQIDQNYSYSLNNCFRKAITNLSDKFSNDELIEIRNSLSFGCPNTSQMQSSADSVVDISDDSPDDTSDEAFAKLQLLYAKYCDKSGVLNQNTLAILYKTATIAAPEWEESHYNLGMYCNKIYNNYEESKKNSKSFSLGKPEEILEMKGRAVKSLVQSLKFGVKHAHNSLPLLFNIWLDLGTELYQMSKSKNSLSLPQHSEEIRKTIERMNNAINDLVANVPLFIFFISFAQLTARVLHPNTSITATLKKILTKLIISFPQQSMWLLIRSLNSINGIRKQIFKELLSKTILQDPNGVLKKFIPDITDFAKLLIEMCTKSTDANRSKVGGSRGPSIKQLSLRKDFPQLARLFARGSNFSPILLPFRSLVSVTLPKSMHETNYNPFPTRDIFITNFDDCIELLHSLQRPKKIKINGSDGKTYTILCKPGDDLRKDYCFIEFCNLLNRCFKRDSEARRRQLRVKTYLVVSLTDTCGLIEWIPGLMPFRTIVEEQYRLNGMPTGDYDSIRDGVIRHYPQTSLAKPERIRRFREDILPQFKPSIFSYWFATTYSDPLSWFAARQAYTRSSAIFSIVGYLLGLGDRHGENIMIEEMSGETVHVDLNCMFNKGEEFAVPERVPFRLTHNMVSAMGVTEFEGTFRKACEQSLKVARLNKEALMNFASPFRFDHLKEWGGSSGAKPMDSRPNIETLLEHAEKIVFNIEARLNGIPSRNDRNLPKGISLSIEGQVDHIIKEATDINNLGVMYVGWTAYL